MIATQNLDSPLWRPPPHTLSSMDRYRRRINQRFGQNLSNSHDLHRWSVESPHEFWIDLYNYLDFRPHLPRNITKGYDDSIPMSNVPTWFDGHLFNYAENALYSNPDPDACALIDLRESNNFTENDGQRVSWKSFRDRVRRTASALRKLGIQKGDRVAALVATSVWAVVLFHASASIGAIFTSVSPELGLEGCVSRFQQVTPSILFADGETLWKGKATSTADKIRAIRDRLSSSLPVYVIPIHSSQSLYPTIDDFLAYADQNEELTFTRVPFHFPLLIAYSSGTTGAPKCIVHSHSILLQLEKIAVVHNGTTPSDVILQYSSTSWIVFYIMCGYTASGATTILYNGSPTYPRPDHLLRVAETYGVTYFGTSPRYLLELEQHGIVPREKFDLSSLRIVYSTGATLSAEQYRWFYRSFPSTTQLCNTAGGTDTATSLVAGDPSGPIYAGEMQMLALGMDVDILDPVTGKSIIETGEPGEMVIKKPFPSMPCFFWADQNNVKYRETYFSRFANSDVWAQADWLSYCPPTKGFVMHGRSDGVLNPSGIRFGSSEIYAIVEAAPFNSVIKTTLCVGRRRPHDRDEQVFLFVVAKQPGTLTSELIAQLRNAIRKGLSARHVPAFIVEVPDIPETINGKKVETVVKQMISGKEVEVSNTVVNPESVEYFRRMRTMERAKL